MSDNVMVEVLTAKVELLRSELTRIRDFLLLRLNMEVAPIIIVKELDDVLARTMDVRTATYGPYMNVGGTETVTGYSVSYYLDGKLIKKDRFETREMAIAEKERWEAGG